MERLPRLWIEANTRISMRRLDIANTHTLVLEAWEYGTVASGTRFTVLNHPDGYALLTLSDLCALRFLQDLKSGLPDVTGNDPPFPLVETFLPSGATYANGAQDDVFVCREPILALPDRERREVMQAARAVFSRVAAPPDADESEDMLRRFREELRQRVPAWVRDGRQVSRLLSAVRHALHWWVENEEHAPQESFVFGTALATYAWQTPRGAVLLPHIFCDD